MRLIIDASVALKWFIPEEFSDAADQIISSEHDLIAPEFMLIELGNVFWKKTKLGEMSFKAAEDALYEASHSPIYYYPVTKSLIARSLNLAQQFKHPVYDCIYLALAEQEAGTVITADKKFFGQIAGDQWKKHIMWLGNAKI